MESTFVVTLQIFSDELYDLSVMLDVPARASVDLFIRVGAEVDLLTYALVDFREAGIHVFNFQQSDIDLGPNLGDNFTSVFASFRTLVRYDDGATGTTRIHIDPDLEVAIPSAIPEPSTYALLGIGVMGFAMRLRRSGASDASR